MISAAVILLPTRSRPLTVVGGLSLLKRAIFTAQRAGAKTCYLVSAHTAEQTSALRRSLAGDPRLRSRLVWLGPQETPPDPQTGGPDAEQCLAFEVQTVFAADLARDLAEAATPQAVWAVGQAPQDYALVVFPLLSLPATLARLQTAGAELAGGDWGAEVQRFAADGYFLAQVSRPSLAADVEKALLLSLPNPRDGLVDAYLNRKLSRPLTRLLLRTPLTPNHVTLLSCGVGLLGAACFWGGGYVWPIVGGLLLQLSAVVDCVDGEVARVKFLESPLGAWLDITLDTLVHIAIFVGVGIAVWKQGGATYAPLLGGALAVGAAICFPFVTMAEKTEEQGKQQGGWENAIIQNMIEGLTSRDYSIIILLCALVQKLAWFLWSAAIGVQVFWCILAVLLHKAGRLNWAVFSSRSLDA